MNSAVVFDNNRRDITKICLDFFKSKDILCKIMASTRMQLHNKLIFIKYLNSIEKRITSSPAS